MGNAIVLVLTRCTDPAREAEFNRWYDEVHLPDILAAPHVVSAQRYQLAGRANTGDSGSQYLAEYRLDTDDVRTALRGIQTASNEATAAGRMIDCLEVISVTTYIALGAEQRAAATPTA